MLVGENVVLDIFGYWDGLGRGIRQGQADLIPPCICDASPIGISSFSVSTEMNVLFPAPVRPMTRIKSF